MMAAEDREKMEKTLVNLLEYQKQYNIKSQDLMIMMSLISLMNMIDILNRDQPAGAAAPNMNNLQAMLGPLLALMMTSDRGSAGGGEDGKPAPFNPAMLFNLLSTMGGGQAGGGQTKGGQPDLSGLMWLLAPLLGGQFKQSPPQSTTDPSKKPAQPVQRELNLDLKEHKAQDNKTKEKNIPEESTPKDSKAKENIPAEFSLPSEKKEKLPKPGEVLEWKFGVS